MKQPHRILFAVAIVVLCVGAAWMATLCASGLASPAAMGERDGQPASPSRSPRETAAEASTPVIVREEPDSGRQIRVCDESGSPIAGAIMCVDDPAARWTRKPGGSQSDAKGMLALSQHAEPGFRTFVWARGYGPEEWLGQPRVMLKRRCSLRAHVTTVSGEPVRGCKVWLSRTEANIDWDAIRDEQPVIVPTTAERAVYVGATDDAGRAAIAGLPEGSYAYGIWHPEYVLVQQLQPPNGAAVEVPGGAIECLVASRIGVRVECRGEEVLSHCYLGPSGAWIDSKVSALGALDHPSELGSCVELSGWPTRDGPSITVHLFALLSRSGPRRFDLKLVPRGSPDYTLVSTAQPGSMGCGKVRFEIVDARGVAISPVGSVSTVGGVRLSDVSRERIPSLNAEDLEWGARIDSDAPYRLRAGRYRYRIQDRVIASVLAPTEFVVREGEDVTVRLVANAVVGRVQCRYPADVRSWTIQLAQVGTATQQSPTIAMLKASEVANLWLTPGQYDLVTFAFGYAPCSRRLVVNGEEQLLEFEPTLATHLGDKQGGGR